MSADADDAIESLAIIVEKYGKFFKIKFGLL
jgi:hypothetical protein